MEISQSAAQFDTLVPVRSVRSRDWRSEITNCVRLGSTGLWYAKTALEVLGGEFEENGWARKRSLKKTGWNRKLTLEELKKVEERKMEDVHNVQEITCSISVGVFG